MAEIKNDVSGENYKKFIQYMCNDCKFLCFTITTYDYIYNNYGNKEEYKEYIKNMDRILKKLNPYILKTIRTPLNFLILDINYEREEWENEKYLYDIYLLKMTKEVRDILLEETKNLFSWKKPFLPEDLMFIKDNFIKASIISYENHAYIYCESKEEFEEIKEIGIELCEKYNNKYEEKIKKNSNKIVQTLLE